jgi:hypothetical protein
MDLKTSEQDFREKVSDKVRISSEGVDRFRVFTPFMLEDGDHLSIVLKRDSSAWVLSDEGHTCMRLTYDVDEKGLLRGIGQETVMDTLSIFNVKDRAGELIVIIEDDQFGDALHAFIHALLKITELTSRGS